MVAHNPYCNESLYNVENGDRSIVRASVTFFNWGEKVVHLSPKNVLCFLCFPREDVTAEEPQYLLSSQKPSAAKRCPKPRSHNTYDWLTGSFPSRKKIKWKNTYARARAHTHTSIFTYVSVIPSSTLYFSCNSSNAMLESKWTRLTLSGQGWGEWHQTHAWNLVRQEILSLLLNNVLWDFPRMPLGIANAFGKLEKKRPITWMV